MRSDDWLARLPMALSQTQAQPSLPVVNPALGYAGGYRTSTGVQIPARHWLMIFRPQLWGYWLGPDLGLAWDWNFRIFFLFTAAAYCLSLFLDPWPAAFAAMALVFSPFFQFWSFAGEPQSAFALLILGLMPRLMRQRSAKSLFAYGLILAWAGTGFGLCNLYPPYIVVLGWLLVLFSAGTLFSEISRRKVGILRPLLAILFATTAALAIAGAFYFENRDVIEIIAQTVYPGQTLAHSGGAVGRALLNGPFSLFMTHHPVNADLNLCEDSSFLLFGPLALAAFLAGETKKHRKAQILGVLGLVGLLTLWLWVPGLDHLGQWTFLNRVAGNRAKVAFGLADLLLVALCWDREELQTRRQKLLAQAACVGFCFFLVLSLFYYHGVWHPHRGWAFGTSIVACSALGWLYSKRHRAFFPSLAIASLIATLGFNPVAHGAWSFFESNALSTTMKQEEAQLLPRHSRWLVLNSLVLSSYPRILGLESLGGVHFYPQFELWKILDPQSQARDVYNRYAHVSFKFSPEETIRIASPQADVVETEINPANPALLKLGVTHMLWADAPSETPASLELVATAPDGRYRVYRLKNAFIPRT